MSNFKEGFKGKSKAEDTKDKDSPDKEKGSYAEKMKEKLTQRENVRRLRK